MDLSLRPCVTRTHTEGAMLTRESRGREDLPLLTGEQARDINAASRSAGVVHAFVSGQAFT